jgi:hypothetical protein
MDRGVLIENPPNFFDDLKSGLSRVAGMHPHLRLDTLDVRALVLDHSVIALRSAACSPSPKHLSLKGHSAAAATAHWTLYQ